MTLLGNGRIVTPDAVLDPGWIEVDGERIAGLGAGQPPRQPDHDLAGHIVVPGFVDTHVHGGGGATYTSADPADTARVAAFHLSQGTTTTFASLVSTTAAELERQVATYADLVADGAVAGVHLEGPWLSEVRRGAHDPSVLRPATREEVARLLELGRGSIKMVTLAPELPGGLDAVRQVIDAGVQVAVGHSDAAYDTVISAIEAGATVATHLFNGMPPMHHRAPGPVGALLEDERVTVELIADGVHLHATTVGLAVRAAGVDRVSLVTDAMAAAGVGDGVYGLAGRSVEVVDGVARLAGGGSIAGSTLSMAGAFRFAVRQVGLPLEAAARMASTTPARSFGLGDVGALRTGLRADLVELDEALEVVAVMRGGAWATDQHAGAMS